MGRQKTQKALAPDPQNVPPKQHDKVELSEQLTNIDLPDGEFDLKLPPQPSSSIPNVPNKTNTHLQPNSVSARSPEPLSKAGHRNRLRTRFREGGADALPDYELLELILFRAIPRKDTKDLAKRLLEKLGSFSEVVNAPEHLLKEIPGIGDSVITEFKLIHAVAIRMMKTQVLDKPVLSSWSDLIDYIRAVQAYENREFFRILFLDKKNRLIADEIQGQGTVDHTPVYIREVVKRALELSATAIILVHNHPSGDPTPSRADINMTRLICDAAKPLGITVHDHIIVGREGHASFKALKLL